MHSNRKPLVLVPLLGLIMATVGCDSSTTSPDPLSIDTTILPDGAVGLVYQESLSVSGGSGTTVWTLDSGSLPDGLTLDGSGAISGTPGEAGSFTFTVQVERDSRTDDQVLTIDVEPCVLESCAALEGYWRFDEPTLVDDSTVGETSLNQRVGIVDTDDVEEMAVPGQVGNGISLDGAADFVSVPDAPGLDLDSDFTLMAWVNARALSAGHRALISKHYAGGRPPSLWLFGDHVEVWFTPGGLKAQSIGTLTPDEWYHLAVTFDDDADEIVIYIDGTADTTVSDVDSTPDVNDEPLLFGQRGDDAYFFDGILDEVMVWSRALAATEIAEIYDATD